MKRLLLFIFWLAISGLSCAFAQCNFTSFNVSPAGPYSAGDTIHVSGNAGAGFGAHPVAVYLTPTNCNEGARIADNYLLSNQCSNGNADFGGYGTSTNSVYVIVPSSIGPGNYYICAFIPITNPCGGTSTGCACNTAQSILISCITDVTDNDPHGTFTIYPNPANDKVILELPYNIITNSIVSIYNVNGQLLMQQVLNQRMTEIDMGNFEKGVYIVIIRNEEGAFLFDKLIKY